MDTYLKSSVANRFLVVILKLWHLLDLELSSASRGKMINSRHIISPHSLGVKCQWKPIASWSKMEYLLVTLFMWFEEMKHWNTPRQQRHKPVLAEDLNIFGFFSFQPVIQWLQRWVFHAVSLWKVRDFYINTTNLPFLFDPQTWGDMRFKLRKLWWRVSAMVISRIKRCAVGHVG